MSGLAQRALLCALLLPSASALAELPSGLRPRIEPAASLGALSSNPAPACRPFAQGLLLCFELVEQRGVRKVTQADLLQWQSSLESLESKVLPEFIKTWRPQELLEVQVEGDSRTYWMANTADGTEQAALFAPDSLSRLLGGPVAVGLPCRGVLLAFKLGDPELEKIVAVGVRRAWESLPEPISPTLYVWYDQAWRPRSEAVPEPTAPTAP